MYLFFFDPHLHVICAFITPHKYSWADGTNSLVNCKWHNENKLCYFGKSLSPGCYFLLFSLWPHPRSQTPIMRTCKVPVHLCKRLWCSTSNRSNNIKMAASSRFASQAEEDIEQVIMPKNAKNTRSLIEKSVKLLNAYCVEKGIADVDRLNDTEVNC